MTDTTPAHPDPAKVSAYARAVGAALTGAFPRAFFAVGRVVLGEGEVADPATEPTYLLMTCCRPEAGRRPGPMNRREAHASALDYIVRLVRAQDNVDAMASYLGLPNPWQGNDTHPDVALLDTAVDDVLDELRRRLRHLKTRPVGRLTEQDGDDRG